MSKSRTALLTAMRRTSDGPCKPKTCSEWLAAAARSEELGSALRKIYGSKLPSVHKLGQDFSEWTGKLYGEEEYRIVSVYDSHAKRARYAVETRHDIEACEQSARLEEAKQDVIAEDRLVRASERLTRKMLAGEEKKRDAEKLAEISNLTIEVMPHPAHVPPVEYEATTRVTSDGRIISTPVMGRDGQPIKKHPIAEVTPAKPAEPERPMTRVEEMRARYLRHHFPQGARLACESESTAPGGFSNPGGIVAHNINAERVDTDPRHAWRYAAGDPNWTKRL